MIVLTLFPWILLASGPRELNIWSYLALSAGVMVQIPELFVMGTGGAGTIGGPGLLGKGGGGWGGASPWKSIRIPIYAYKNEAKCPNHHFKNFS